VNICIKNLLLTTGVFVCPVVLAAQGQKVDWSIYILLYLGLNVILDLFDIILRKIIK
jgi:hypothetical protein